MSRSVPHSEHRFLAPSSKDGCHKPVLGVWVCSSYYIHSANIVFFKIRFHQQNLNGSKDSGVYYILTVTTKLLTIHYKDIPVEHTDLNADGTQTHGIN